MKWLLFIIFGIFVAVVVSGQSLRDIPKIEADKKEVESKIDLLQKEIDNITEDLSHVKGRRVTLEGELSILDKSRRQAVAEKELTEARIRKATLELGSLSTDIRERGDQVSVLSILLSSQIQQYNEIEQRGAVLAALSGESFLYSFQQLETFQTLGGSILDEIEKLNLLTQNLKISKERVSDETIALRGLERELKDREFILTQNVERQKDLVDTTKNEEGEFQLILKKKEEEREKLNQELLAYESRIQFILDPGTIPSPRKGLFRWPIDPPIRITQGFGRTAFARSSGYYTRSSHPGVDFASSIGSSVYSPLGGRITAIGNTNAVSSCQPFGKWIIINHGNGLATLYGHLSLIKVREGEIVDSGDLIARSGNTGLSTGPHLHFGVYAKDGLRVVPYSEISSSSRCRGLKLPVAAQTARIDPIVYLPPR